MKALFFIALMFLASCTFAINDPIAFDQNAEKMTKTYPVNRENLYTCFMDNVGLTTDDMSYSTGKTYRFKKPGLVEVTFIAPASNQTTVTSQAAPGGDWTITAKRFIGITDKCAAILLK